MNENKMEKLLKLAYQQVKIKSKTKPIGRCFENEDIACVLEGKLPIKKLKLFTDHILSCRECADALKDNIAISKAMRKEELSTPAYLHNLTKSLVSEEVRGNILDIALCFKEKAIELIRTTGEIIIGKEPVPIAALRSRGANDNMPNEVQITKTLSGLVAEVDIEKQRLDHANIVIRLTEKETNKKAKDIRVSLIKNDREIESSLIADGKVKFEEMKANDYKIYLIKDEKKIGIINISIVPKKQ